ncbi:MAG: integrase arm-type DNA-binding domain-containing protein [Acidobacteria bacterium]|nr:integrase arm-type DNA-binding domain-containing protein [Acidobacteriota bacterium]
MKRLRFALTDTALRAAKPSDKPYKLADGGGLYARVNPNGSIYWRFKHIFEGKEKLLALGQYPATTLAEARRAHHQAKLKLHAGIDPSAARQIERAEQQAEAEGKPQEITFGLVADDWLKTRVPQAYASEPITHLRKLSKTFARDERMAGYLKSSKGTARGFGGVALDQIELGHLVALLREVNYPTRTRLISTARKVVAYAKALGIWPKHRPSPFADVDFGAGFAKHREGHRPAITDPVEFGQLLRKIEFYEGRGDNLIGHALRLLALTFVRPGTVATARWAHFDLVKARWIVPFAKLNMATERHERGDPEDDYIVPLSRQAAKLLEELHKIKEEYLFPGRSNARPIATTR